MVKEFVAVVGEFSGVVQLQRYYLILLNLQLPSHLHDLIVVLLIFPSLELMKELAKVLEGRLV